MNRLLLAFFLLFTSLNHAQEKNYTEAFQLVEVWLEAQKDFDQLPGISAIVVEDQEVLWSGAFGLANKENNLKTKASTLCSICSISKLFTAVAIMKLYDEGKLRLDDEIGDLLPRYNLEQSYRESGPLTIRSILTHSSGLPREANFPYWTGPDFPFPSQEQIDANLENQETLYPASTYFQYSNLGLTLLGEVVEEISGMAYEEYVEQHILIPLGLENTRPEMPEKLYGKELAVGYSAVARNGQREKVNFFQANGIAPAAGFSSNVHDLGKFASWQFRLRDTTASEILKPATLKNMQRIHWVNPQGNPTWGLGFSVSKDAKGNIWVGHGGSCPGYRSIFRMDIKNKRAFSVMINASGTDPGKYVKGINQIMSKVKKENKKENSINLTDYVGYYNSQPWWGESYIGTWEGKLVSISLPTDNPGDGMNLFKYIGNDTFKRIKDNGELGETMVFERNDQGKVTRIKRHGNYNQRISR